MKLTQRLRVTVSTLLLSAALLFAVVLAGGSGCKSTRLEPGGAYAPTNATGQIIYNDKGLALVDATYKVAYESIQVVFAYERDNREAIWAVSKDVKQGLDQARNSVAHIEKRWAVARRAYKANPAPANLSVMQTVLSELNRLIPAVQSQIKPVQDSLTLTNR